MYVPVTTAQSTTSVNVQNFAFNPSSIRVVIGVNNTVTWTNHDSVAHTVTADDGSFNGNLTVGGTFTHTFTVAGTYAYHCNIHTYIKATVIVLGGPSSTSTSTSASGGGIPEFPAQALAVATMTAIVLVSYLALRRTGRSKAG